MRAKINFKEKKSFVKMIRRNPLVRLKFYGRP